MALDEILPYTEALAAWLASNCQDESHLLPGKALQDALTWVGRRSLSEQDYQFLIASQELEKRELVKQLETTRQDAQDTIRGMNSYLVQTCHELRTPLSSIIGYFRLIREGRIDSPEEEREFIDIAHESAFYLLDILNELLYEAKIEAGKIDFVLAAVGLYELLAEVEQSIPNQAQEKQLNFQITQSATQNEIFVYADYYRLRDVMDKLIEDAICYTPEGGITITGEVIEQNVVVDNQEYPGLAKIHISANRSKHQQDNLLRFMSWIDGSTQDIHSSPNGRLAISYKLLEAMGGELNFDIKGEGIGSTVTITLPLYQEPGMS